jgi:hypothetical protein
LPFLLTRDNLQIAVGLFPKNFVETGESDEDEEDEEANEETTPQDTSSAENDGE